jgi:hypothetical protein
VGYTFAQTLAGASAGDLRFQAAAFAGLEIKGVLFGVGYDAFAGDLPLEATYCALDALVVVNLYSSHSILRIVP